jgi:N-acetylglucosamine kinase-like BadF-type ATPase
MKRDLRQNAEVVVAAVEAEGAAATVAAAAVVAAEVVVAAVEAGDEVAIEVIAETAGIVGSL